MNLAPALENPLSIGRHGPGWFQKAGTEPESPAAKSGIIYVDLPRTSMQQEII